MYMTIVMDHFPRTRQYKPALAVGICLPLFGLGAIIMCNHVSTLYLIRIQISIYNLNYPNMSVFFME